MIPLSVHQPDNAQPNRPSRVLGFVAGQALQHARGLGEAAFEGGGCGQQGDDLAARVHGASRLVSDDGSVPEGWG